VKPARSEGMPGWLIGIIITIGVVAILGGLFLIYSRRKLKKDIESGKYD
jgi:hypothetical protein